MHLKSQISNLKSVISNLRFPMLFAIAGSIIASGASRAAADAITFVGSIIALRDCRIEGVQGGQVFYADSRGQRQRRPIEEVQAIAFDDLPSLEAAEKALGGSDDAAGLIPLLTALLDAKTELHKQWVRYRLVRYHEGKGETVQAIGHAAAIMGSTDDPSWKSIEPIAALNNAEFVAVKEAHENLLAALRQAKHAELKSTLDRMSKKIQPLHDQLAAANTGAATTLGGTLSGISIQSIKAGEAQAPKVNAVPEEAKAPPPPIRANPRAVEAPKGLESPNTDASSPQAIDALLEKSRAIDALAQCVAVAKDPGDRDLAHFLYQYGLALARNDKADDAAVMFTRSAAIYPDSEAACHSLIQLAILHRDAMKQPSTARRLMELAHARAKEHGHAAATMLAAELMPSVAK